MKVPVILPVIIASILVIGGIFWGILILPMFFGEKFIFVAIIFAPGYISTAGCLVRVFFKLPLPYRRIIWGISIVVQAGWLLWHIFASINAGVDFSRIFNPPIIIGWWIAATLLSIVGLIVEKDTI